ncbi:MAG: NmrA family NAD(P)-binding protein [Ignavibacteria bacterium]|nr:NmrA family NAD(P)-binding protein [Ignavibacteria bacterium]
MKTLVIGGTGTVGSQVVANLVAKKAKVRVMTSSADKVNAMPGGAEGVVGNLTDKGSLAGAFNGIERACVITALSENETEQGLNAVAAAKGAGVRRFVYMSIHRLEDIPEAPHFASKVPIEKAIRESGMAYTIIRPNNFYQNDYWFQQPILEYGVYAQPIGNKGVSRVDVRDIGEALTNALLDDGHEGKTYNLVGPGVCTADKTAQLYGKALGKDVVYAGDDLEQWGAAAVKMMPQWLVDDLKLMYRSFQTKGFEAKPGHLEETVNILGKNPRSFNAFVDEVTSQWKSAKKGGVKV